MKSSLFVEVINQGGQRLDCSDPSISFWSAGFASTSGPRGGIGGMMMTTFTVVGFWDDSTDSGIKWCAGVWRKWNGDPDGW